MLEDLSFSQVAACECLHSLVLYMLGKSVTQPQGTKKVRITKHLVQLTKTTLITIRNDHMSVA